MLSSLDNISISTISNYLPYEDYPSIREIIESVDPEILNPTYHNIPTHRAREYFIAREFDVASIWGFMSVMISRKLYIGEITDASDGAEMLTTSICTAINSAYSRLIACNKKEWFLANCEYPHIYEEIKSNKILRLAPISTVSKFVRDAKRLAKIYRQTTTTDEIYAYIIKNFTAQDSIDLDRYNVIDIATAHPVIFTALTEMALDDRYTFISNNDTYDNIDAAIIHYLHTTSGAMLTEDGEVHCERKKNIVIIRNILSCDLGSMSVRHRYIANFKTAQVQYPVDERKSLHYLKCIGLATKYERDLINGLSCMAEDDELAELTVELYRDDDDDDDDECPRIRRPKSDEE